MAKRFTDTNKYKKPFIRGLQGPYKLLWDYLYLDCSHAGIWIVDFEIAQLYLGADMPVNKIDALKYFNNGEKRIIEIDKGKKWFIPSFLEFQYGDLNPENRAHNSVIKELKKYNLMKNKNKPLTSPLQGAKDKDKDKVKDKDKDKEKANGYKESIDCYFKLYQDKMELRPLWGKKEGELLKTDLKRLSTHPNQKNYEILSFALEAFFKDEVRAVTEFAQKAGYTYGVFHSKLDSILNYLGRKN